MDLMKGGPYKANLGIDKILIGIFIIVSSVGIIGYSVFNKFDNAADDQHRCRSILPGKW